MKRIPNFIEFVHLTWPNLEIILLDEGKAHTDGRNRVWINRNYPADVQKFMILHELGHIYLNYLNHKFGSTQHPLLKENETLCDILASIYLIRQKCKKPREIIKYLTILYPSPEAKFRIHMLRNVLLIASKKGGKRCSG